MTVLAVALTGCLPALDGAEQEHDTAAEQALSTDTGSSDADAVLARLEQAFGPAGGGTETTISGGPFVDVRQVRFAGTPGELVEVGPEAIVVRSPAGAVGDAEVVVELGQRLVPAGSFRYLDFDDHRGLAGALGIFEWTDYLGSYWAGSPSPFGGAFWRVLDTPVDLHVWELYAAEAGACVSDAYDWQDLDGADLGVDHVQLAADGASVTLPWEDEGAWFAGDLADQDFVDAGAYELVFPGSEAVPAFELADFVLTPAPWSLTSPAVAGDEVAWLAPDELHFVWSGAASADRVVLQLERTDPSDQSVVRERVTCQAEGDALTVPPEVWQDWQVGEIVQVSVAALQEGEAVLPYDHSDARVVGARKLRAAFYAR